MGLMLPLVVPEQMALTIGLKIVSINHRYGGIAQVKLMGDASRHRFQKDYSLFLEESLIPNSGYVLAIH